MAKLVFAVLAILSGTAVAVDSYLDSAGHDARQSYQLEASSAPVSRDLLPLFEVPRPQRMETISDSEPIGAVSPASSASARKRRARSAESTLRVTLVRKAKSAADERGGEKHRPRTPARPALEAISTTMTPDDGSL